MCFKVAVWPGSNSMKENLVSKLKKQISLHKTLSSELALLLVSGVKMLSKCQFCILAYCCGAQLLLHSMIHLWSLKRSCQLPQVSEIISLNLTLVKVLALLNS